MNKFQLIIYGTIAAAVLLAVLVLSGVIPGLPGMQKGPVPTLTLWGVLPKDKINNIIDSINEKNQKVFGITYIEKNKETYESELVDALAGGKGPDMWLMTQDRVLKQRDKSFQIPFSVFSQRDFYDSFIDEARLFEFREGITAVPFLVDPVLLYWNKDLFNRAGLAKPPRSWDEFLNFSQLLTSEDAAGNLVQSGAALGEFSNVRNAKDIFSLLVLQAGNKIVERRISGGSEKIEVVFGEQSAAAVEPVAGALNFFTAFSDPAKVSYSWNRALPDSREMFLSGKLAMYLGYAGEFAAIKEGNPHLNFDVAVIPQLNDSSGYLGFGKIYGLAISKASANINAALVAAFKFADASIVKDFELATSLSPVRRDLLAERQPNPALAVFHKAALRSAAWLEPDPKAVSDIFKNMIESVGTGRKRISSAVSDAAILLEAELKKVTSNK